MSLRAVVFICLLSVLLSACSWDSVPDGRILVRNDSQDREFNVISVSGNGASRSLKPGEYLILPPRTTNFFVSRRYKDYTRSYSVRCPAINGSGIVIKMIDIHLNRMKGGCVTTNASR